MASLSQRMVYTQARGNNNDLKKRNLSFVGTIDRIIFKNKLKLLLYIVYINSKEEFTVWTILNFQYLNSCNLTVLVLKQSTLENKLGVPNLQ